MYRFISFARQKGFKVYTDSLLFPTYDKLAASGALGDKPSKANYFAARILSDEAIASKAVEAVTDVPDSTMMVLQVM
jgi:hypothetical protein